MILALLVNADLLSVVYALSIFAYAMLEESRPKKAYWKIMLIYTELVVLVKFVLQIDLLTVFDTKDNLQELFEPLVTLCLLPSGWLQDGTQGDKSGRFGGVRELLLVRPVRAALYYVPPVRAGVHGPMGCPRDRDREHSRSNTPICKGA